MMVDFKSHADVKMDTMRGLSSSKNSDTVPAIDIRKRSGPAARAGRMAPVPTVHFGSWASSLSPLVPYL